MQIFITYTMLVIFWSTTPLAIQWSTLNSSFSFGVAARMLIGLAVCLLILGLIRQKLIWNKNAIKVYLSASIGIFGAMSAVYWSSQFIPSGLIAVIFGLTPLFTMLIEYWLMNKKKISPFKIAGVLIAVIGLTVIFYSDFSQYKSAFKGIIGVLFATLLHAFSAVLTKKNQAKIPSFTVTTGGLLLSLPFFILVWFMTDGTLPNKIEPIAAYSILYLAVIATAIGFNLYYYALKLTNASTLSLVTLFTPVTALLLGLVLNNEVINTQIILGTCFILIGLFVNQHAERIYRATNLAIWRSTTKTTDT